MAYFTTLSVSRAVVYIVNIIIIIIIIIIIVVKIWTGCSYLFEVLSQHLPGGTE
jgi:hypothetical protein